jgi:predicted ester cyclase
LGAQANTEAVNLAIERWNAHDDSYFTLYADDLVAHDQPPDVPPTLEGLKGLFHQMWASFPDARVSALAVVAEGDLAAVHLQWNGTHKGEFFGAAPSGNRIDFRVMAFLRFGPDGKVVERWTRLDEVGLLTQLGLMPAPASSPA